MLKYLLLIIFICLIVFGVVFYMNTSYNIQEPSFSLIKKDGEFEIRSYKGLIFAETKKIGSRKDATNAGFKTLANYIFTRHQIKECGQIKMEKIPMTIPVIVFPENFKIDKSLITDESQSWVTRFVMPKNKELSWFPKPETDDIKIFQEGSKDFVCLKFNGPATNAQILEKINEMKYFVEKNSIQVKDLDKIILAFYSPPWTLPNLKRNEIMLEIQVE